MKYLVPLTLLALVLNGCSNQQAEPAQLLDNQASSLCATAAYNAVEAIQKLNPESTRKAIDTVRLSERSATHEVIQVWLEGSPFQHYYLVNTAKLVSGSCKVFGLSLITASGNNMLDYGYDQPMSGGPSASCKALSIAAIKALEAANGIPYRMADPQLVGAHSDHEVHRTKIWRYDVKGFANTDSYLTALESWGGDPCVLYGIQLRSNELDLSGEQDAEPIPQIGHATPIRYTQKFKRAWNEVKQPSRYHQMKAITFFKTSGRSEVEVVGAVVRSLLEYRIPTNFVMTTRYEGAGDPLANDEVIFRGDVHLEDFNRMLDDYWYYGDRLTDAQKDSTRYLQKTMLDYVGPGYSTWGNQYHDWTDVLGAVVLVSADRRKAVYIHYDYLDL